MADQTGFDMLLDESPLPFGAPQFDRIMTDRFLPAFQIAIAEAAAEIAAIADNSEAATFTNTIEALERCGASLSRVRRIFYTLSSAQSDALMRKVEPEISALLTRHGTAVSHNANLFARVRTVWESRDRSALDEAQRRLVEDSYEGYVKGGAALAEAEKVQFAAIVERLSALSTEFGHNVLAEAADWEMLLTDGELDGLPAGMRASAKARAAAKGHDEAWLFTLDRGDMEGLLTFSTRRDLRERMWRAFTTRCNGGAHDNRAIVDEMLALRHERAALLGYATYADYALSDSMAKTPDAAEALLMRVWEPAVREAANERAELQRIASTEGATFEVAGWDWRYYAERIRRDRFALDGAEVKKHLLLEVVIDAAFSCAEQLYGLSFRRHPELPGWHPDVNAWGVFEKGTEIGLLYTDYFARPEKHGGAWMGSLRVQEKLDRPVLPIAYLVANFPTPAQGEDVGLSIDEARTLFHEFGHALHGLLSDVKYPSQSGTAVARDFVELPSKFMEHWILAPETLREMAVPEALIAAIGHVDDFGQGFATVELVSSALVDMALHRCSDDAPDSAAIEAATLARLHMPAAIAPRQGVTHFTHVFDGGYASAYYSYLWSEVLDADAFSAFCESGNIFDPGLAGQFRREILARGNTRDPMASFIAFRGREPDETALLKERRLV
ncbi:M3 family metallopeptidase [Sphingomonas sp.]|uniref:M3 family metallopeptidase n=1 Tax=Sphingomonas sp. TaxID=28214 RepID=UPI0025D8ADA1|nr:M3 family metallopeptidase [Sphingomonas sp.]